MDLVTLTDHDTIAGGLELITRPDFFLSEEVSTVFPEDGCALHVLAWNITPAQHDRLQAARSSVYDLVEVLRRESITHACAHPLFSPNWKLSVGALEKILVLFPLLESTNGLSPQCLEVDLRTLCKGLDDAILDGLARRHRLPRSGVGVPRFVAGSDAHTERHCAGCYTQVEGCVGVDAFLGAVAQGNAITRGESAALEVMAMTTSRVSYGFLSGRRLEDPAYRDPFVDLVDVLAGREVGTDNPTGIRDELIRSMLKGAARTAVPRGPHLDLDSQADVMTEFRRIHDGLMSHALEELHEGVRDLDMYRVLGAVRDTVGAFVTAVPYLFAVDHFARQRKQARDVVAAWQASPRPPQVACLAIFSDSIDHVDGVTSSLRRFVREATREGRNVRIPYCGARPVDANDVVYRPLAAVLSETTTLYADLELHVPSLLDTIDWLWRNNITHVELATPGPMGLVGLIAARLLRLPVTASYHTEVLKLLSQLSNSALLHKAASALTTWFYKTVDKVFAFSESSRQSLLQLGVPSARIEHVSVAIDPHEFSPAYAEATAFGALGIDVECERVILTVGRLSREKRVDVIIEAIDRIQNTPRAPVLVIVGDGPERAALERLAAGKAHVVFVGVQRGDTLKRLYASASAFVFASRIDTLGLATMEAMASGIPVIVPADSAIAELVVADRSGYCYEFGVDGLVEVLIALDESPQHRRSVAESARKAMVARWDQTRFSDLWQRMAGTTSSEA